MRRIVAAGHAVGLHCDEHIRHRDRDRAWLRRDTARALERLAQLGIAPTLWRTPWGDTAPFTAAIAREHRLRVVGWSVDTHDWRGDSVAEMWQATREHLRAGAIVLAHDGIGPGARRPDAGQTVAYTELVGAHAAAAGLELEGLA